MHFEFQRLMSLNRIDCVESNIHIAILDWRIIDIPIDRKSGLHDLKAPLKPADSLLSIMLN